ncbi:MAG: polysaccharide deacetylase family protein [Eubacteriales bacterium]|nr:polysaccharide deacetylase family protein [Eubacteriales bacterium]
MDLINPRSFFRSALHFWQKQIQCLCFILLVLVGVYTPVKADSSESEPEIVQLPIVMYHQLCPDSSRAGTYCLPLYQFESDLRYLKEQGYESISVRTLLDWYEGNGSIPEKPVMITFDDGYLTTMEWAAPLLKEYGFTGIIAPIGRVSQTYTDTPDEQLAYAHCSWPQLAKLADDGILEVQYHSWDMHDLSGRRGCGKKYGESSEDYRSVLSEDYARFLNTAARYEVELAPSAAFPFGCYCQETLQTLRDLGLLVGFTCCEQINFLTGDPDELLELGRYNRPAGPDSYSFFSAWEL